MPYDAARSVPLLALLALAALPGCPNPTGRTRGEMDVTIDTRCSTLRSPGGACLTPGAVCNGLVRCPDGSSGSGTCSCSSGAWQCSANACPPARDGGRTDVVVPTGRCPAAAVRPGAGCVGLTGLFCPGVPTTDCRGVSHSSYCQCASDRWTCDAVACDAGTDGATDAAPDEGVPDAATCPAGPSPGARCVPGAGCWYEGGAACRTYCNCDDSARFACVALPCIDGGAPEAGGADATFAE